jgi:hypothetical protein
MQPVKHVAVTHAWRLGLTCQSIESDTLESDTLAIVQLYVPCESGQ